MRWLACGVALFAAHVASAQTLWQKANIGDKVAAVKAKYPESVPGSSKDNLKDGSTCSLQISTYEVVQTKFRVCFYFLKGALSQVTLSLTDPKRGHDAELSFEAVLEALRAKYGAENNLKRERGILTTFDADWYRGAVNVNLLMMYVGSGDEAIMNINYQTRVGTDAGKL